ncbi:MAG: hypothetical protein HGA33_03720 [Candidatus Moranbacteria bacterium]|nr:hypothetical protein [Candidatus Moranbacteria bacterium]
MIASVSKNILACDKPTPAPKPVCPPPAVEPKPVCPPPPVEPKPEPKPEVQQARSLVVEKSLATFIFLGVEDKVASGVVAGAEAKWYPNGYHYIKGEKTKRISTVVEVKAEKELTRRIAATAAANMSFGDKVYPGARVGGNYSVVKNERNGNRLAIEAGHAFGEVIHGNYLQASANIAFN